MGRCQTWGALVDSPEGLYTAFCRFSPFSAFEGFHSPPPEDWGESPPLGSHSSSSSPTSRRRFLPRSETRVGSFAGGAGAAGAGALQKGALSSMVLIRGSPPSLPLCIDSQWEYSNDWKSKHALVLQAGYPTDRQHESLSN